MPSILRDMSGSHANATMSMVLMRPRESKSGTVTKKIIETLTNDPMNMPYKSKGILLAASKYTQTSNETFELCFDNEKLEGILDGGHNSFAIGAFIMTQVADDPRFNGKIRSVKTWGDLKKMWNENLPVIEESLGDYSNTAFNAAVPIEILVPLDPNDRAVARRFSTQLAAICDARNNNAQLKDDTKMNRSGYFDYLRSTLPEPLANSVQWKSNTRGFASKPSSVIACAYSRRVARPLILENVSPYMVLLGAMRVRESVLLVIMWSFLNQG